MSYCPLTRSPLTPCQGPGGLKQKLTLQRLGHLIVLLTSGVTDPRFSGQSSALVILVPRSASPQVGQVAGWLRATATQPLCGTALRWIPGVLVAI